MITSMIVATSQFAYLSIPASELREFCDGMFPTFAKCSQADFIRGAYHRYKGGHDIVLDVGETLQHDGISEAFRHFGHIVCTDFPTKAGIPIPFFSQSGLGKAFKASLFHSGIHRTCRGEKRIRDRCGNRTPLWHHGRRLSG